MPRLHHLASFTAGALLATTLTFAAIQPFRAGAAPGDTDATYEPINPCRLIDTRTGPSNVGARKAPIGPGETFPVQVTGTNGNCVDIPVGAVGVAMNVTALNATASSNMRIFPGDLAEVPVVANLNYSQVSPPTPNKVDSKLAPDGTIGIFNAFGSVDVIVDVVGVYTNDSLVEIQNRLLTLESQNTDLIERVTTLENSRSFVVDSGPASQLTVGTTRSAVRAVTVTAPVAGRVVVHGAATAVENTAGHDVRCAVSTTPTPGSSNTNDFIWEASGATTNDTSGEGDAGVVAGTRVFGIAAGATTTYYFSCVNTVSGTSEVWGANLTATFIAD